MIRSNYLFTSESVSEGHPDKVCDRISDEIVDAFFRLGPEHGWNPWDIRCAAETLATTNRVVIAGETRGPKQITRDLIAHLARLAIRDIGYEQEGFHWETAQIDVLLHAQSADIAVGVDAAGNKDEGAGDQGIMFGFACDETPDLMPATLDYSHKILQQLADDRHSGAAPFLEPDAKSQVTLRFAGGEPVEATAIVVSTQHKAGWDEGENDAQLKAWVKGAIAKVIPAHLLTANTVYHINPTGSFVVGGPDGDAGLTGRKIIVDTYGGASPHGGGAFSGKDPTKVDRSAAYVTRYLAKNVVASGLARRCTIQVAYAIGVSEPLSLYIDTHGTGVIADGDLETVVTTVARDRLGGLTPRGIRTALSLNKPIYSPTAAYGHFGRKAQGDLFPWERTDLADALNAAAGV